MKTHLRILLAFVITPIMILSLMQNSSLAADIDIYGSPSSSLTNPNVLIIIDNSSNWASNTQHWPVGKQGESELTSLKTIAGEFSDDINVGLMMFTQGTIDGGYVRYHMRTMTNTNKSAFQELIGTSSCVDGNNSLNGTPNCLYKNFQSSSEKVSSSTIDISATMFEAFKYFGGYTNPAHANDDPVTAATPGSPTDATHYGPYRYAGDPEVKADADAYTGGASQPEYNPATTSSCGKNYIIYIGNGPPGGDTDVSILSGVGGDTSQLPLYTYTITSSTSTSAAGNTNRCYASAASVPTSDYPPACATYSSPDSCSVGTSIANSAATACAAGTASYPVLGNIPAQAAVANASHSITSTVQSGNSSTWTITAANHRFAAGSTVTILGCPVGNQVAKTLNGVHTVATSTPASNIFTINDGNNNAPACTTGTVVGTDAAVAASSVALGYSQCSSACSTADFNNLCGSTYPTCSCDTPTVSTSPTCSSGNRYNVNATLNTTTITPSGGTHIPVGSEINYADEWARFLNRTDVSSAVGQQNVITYTIDVFKDQPDANATALFKSMSKAGGGKYFQAQNEAAILDALRKIMSEIQTANSVFASSSLPVSVNTQGTYLNQVFIGMFRPNASGTPRWYGNLKQYQFALDAGHLFLADANGTDAVSSTTGFLTPCAESFWSSDSGNYWDFSGSVAKGGCSGATSQFPSAGSSATYSDLPDGDVVEKGGAAQQLRGVKSSGGVLTASSTNYTSRVLKTCDGSSASSCTSLTNFDTSNGNITQALLGASSSTDRDNLIDWVRGKDNFEDENGNIGTIPDEMRPSVHGDVVHSQPGVVDYGGSTGVVTFYGSNEGVFHAINGQKTASAGNEIWGFIAPETYGRLNRLRTQSPWVNIPGVSTAIVPTPASKGYFFDGSVAVHQKNGTVWIYPTMRRGGRAIYAFDATTPTAAGITLKWRRGCFTDSTTDDTSCSSDTNYPTEWQKIGQTWSKPQIGYLSGYSGPVLVFGGGYDTCEDAESQSRCASTPRKGANIWFVDANTGAIIRTYPTNYSVPGDVMLIKDVNGNITHAYAADTGGYVYRVNVGTWDGTTLGSTWTSNSAASNITIASLSIAGSARKFLSGPDVVETATYNQVLVGSGDREQPMYTDYPCADPVTNAFFMIKDTPSSGYPNPVIAASALADVTTTCPTTNTSGWYFNFPNSCEQSVNKATSIGGYTYFGTSQPVATPPNSCATNLGVARSYAVKSSTGCAPPGASRSVIFTGGGLPPSPVAGVVDVDGTKVTFCLGCGSDAASRSSGSAGAESALGGSDITITPPGTRTRTYWYKK